MTELFGVFGLDIRVLLLQAVNFGIALTVLWYFLYRPLIALIEKRRREIIESVANSEHTAREMREADAKKKEIITKAHLDAEAMTLHAKTHAKELEATMLQEAHAKSEHILREAEARGEELKRIAIAESKEEVAKMVILGVEKMLRERNV